MVQSWPHEGSFGLWERCRMLLVQLLTFGVCDTICRSSSIPETHSFLEKALVYPQHLFPRTSPDLPYPIHTSVSCYPRESQAETYDICDLFAFLKRDFVVLYKCLVGDSKKGDCLPAASYS